MGIRRPFSVADGYVEPTTPEGGLYALIDGNGEYYSAGFQGATQKHPLPLTGGQRISLATGGLPDDATSGYNVITGTGVSQTSNGLEVTLNAGNPDVIIDLPVYGEVVFDSLITEVGIVCAAPGSGTYVGARLDSNNTTGTFSFLAHSDGVDWRGIIKRTSTFLGRGTSAVTLANVGDIDHVYGAFCWAFNATFRSGVTQLGEAYALNPLSTGGNINVSYENTSIPSTWDAALEAHWVSGPDLVVVFKSVATNGPPQLSTEP